MSEFWIYFEIGVRHFLSRNAYEPFLFLMALSIPFAFKDWKKLLILATVFSVSFAIALLLSIYGMVLIKPELINIIIPLSIVVMALYQLFTVGKGAKNGTISVLIFLTLFFGIVDGLKFSNQFKTILDSGGTNKSVHFFEFLIGIEVVQLAIILGMLILAYIAQSGFRFSKRDWTLVITSFIIGVVFPIIIENKFWFR